MANINYIENHSRTSLHFACKSQNLELVEDLLKNGENPDVVDNEMFTPLHWACMSKSDVTVRIIELLLQNNANIEAVDECGWTPLFIACRKRNDVAVKCLLENHANSNARDQIGATPMYWTIFDLYDETFMSIAQLLLQYHANIEFGGMLGRSPLLEACGNCNYLAAKFLLNNHADPSAVDNNGFTSLHIVVQINNNMTVMFIELLIQHHVNIEAVDASGWTPLMKACDENNYNAIKCLVDHHANIKAMNAIGQTPLMIACNNNNHDLMKYLLDHHANIEAVDDRGWTPLIIACKKNNYNVIKNLVDHHANIEAVDERGWTPLIIACKKYNFNVIKYLVEHHANIEAVDERGWTPLMIACNNNDHYLIKYLLDHHANIEAVDERGWTPLMIACNNNDHYLIKYLLDHHANIEAVDSTVSSPFMVACNNHNQNVIKLLLNFEKYRKFKISQYCAYKCSKTPLHLACENQNLELVESLLKNGDSPNAVDNKMNTPLHWACMSKSDVTVRIIELLLQHNANIEAAENECGWTPLFTACIHNNDVAVKYLLENHADSNARDQMGYTPLHWIFFCNSDDIALSIAQLLLQYHAYIEARSYNGRTPFLMACFNCNYVTTKFFLDNHANPFAADNDGCTSLHFVCDRKNEMTVTLIELLIQHHANIDALDKKGWTPLIVASNYGNCEAIQCLFDHYANVNHSDINNSTALHISIERQSVQTTKCLIKCNANINLLDKENQTPLEKALKMKSSDERSFLKIINILKFEVFKLKVAGFKIHDHNLNILHNVDDDMFGSPSLLIHEPSVKDEIKRMKKIYICNKKMTLYVLLKNNIRFLCQFVTDDEIQQQLEQEYLDEQFRFYINIIRNRFREAKILCTRNELINQAKEYFSLYINQQLPYEILDHIFMSLNISELKFFVKLSQEAIG